MTKPNKKIVLTGGPCAGKTTIAQVLHRAFTDQLVILPETATLLFKGGFPRWSEPASLEALQRAVYHVQCASETTYLAHHPGKLLVMDRGTLDGAAYWPSGSQGFFKSLGTTLEAELARYDQVVYLESAGAQDYELHCQLNPTRTENWDEAQRLDDETQKLWVRHPNFIRVTNNKSFSEKIFQVLQVIEAEIKSGL